MSSNKPIGFHATTDRSILTGPVKGYEVGFWKSERVVDYQACVHYHPHTDHLIQTLNLSGLEALLGAQLDKSLDQPLEGKHYTFGDNILEPYPRDEIDVSDDGPYSVYNWELFFHIPLQIAVHLSVNQRFAEAQKWFHRIFDPTNTDPSVAPPQRFWKFLRFRRETDPEFIGDILNALADSGDSELKSRIRKSIQAWRDHPFQPHVVARGRYLAYQMNVLMKYLDNLLAWGDYLFRQNSLETLNEATQIYVLAANLLGPRPQKVPARGKRAARSYAQLDAAGLDEFSNAMIELENDFPFDSFGAGSGDVSASGANSLFGVARSLYFCAPRNDNLLAYWDKVSDRLFKLRHGMNIEGVVQQLPLFDPPIDPGALVKAAAAGLDIASIVNNVNQPLSNLRGPMLLHKALELCGEVKVLGAGLLAALENGDAEHLALLRQQHELNNLNLARDLRFLQWKEAEAATDALLKSRAVAWEEFRHFKHLLGVSDSDIDAQKAVDLARSGMTEETFDSIYGGLVDRYAKALPREAYRKESSVGGVMEFAGEKAVTVFGGELGKTLPLNKNENAELNIFLPTATVFSTAATVMDMTAAGLRVIPRLHTSLKPFGVGGGFSVGGVDWAGVLSDGAEGAKKVAEAFESSARSANHMAGYYRRAEDYVLRANVATARLEQYGRQIIASLIREQIARREYDNHVKQIEASQAEAEFLQGKFTSEELYTWMRDEISRTYYDGYKFTYDTAKRAEQTLKYELMRPEFDERDFIKFGYWDSGRKGLLAGEGLELDLRRMEMAYLEQNRREYELVKHVSLARLDPQALLKLKATGICTVHVPEWLFDLDSPGQYMRRLKTVALSIPCVAEPHTGIHCKLSLLRSSIRISPLANEGYTRNSQGEDARFRDFTGAIQSIVTSTGQNDAGLFEVNLDDERYLPFEGAGADSTWRLELPNDHPQFDFETISDVVLHLRYTAREAGQLRRLASDAVVEQAFDAQNPLLQLFCLNQDFAGAWAAFGAETDDNQRHLQLGLGVERFPYWFGKLPLPDTLSARFVLVDLGGKKLVMTPQAVDLDKDDDQDAWSTDIAQASPAFVFLKKHRQDRVYVLLTFPQN